jgi:cytochrome c oxidase accessory protein FixG
MSNQIHSFEVPDQPLTIVQGGYRRWIFPQQISGKYQTLRNVSSVILLLILYSAPWLKIGGMPFIKLSFLSSSFVMFGSPILIYEFYHFGFLALLLVLTLFIASALWGRVWCGYACPQTVFIEQILGRIDEWIEGPSTKRVLAYGKPLTFERAVRKVLKQLTYGLVSFSFAFTFAAIFVGTDHLIQLESRGAWIAVALLTGLAWFNASFMREQFCHIICPYGRFQGVMQDQNSITIGYDYQRGEPRGRRASGSDITSKKGDCIDCGLCKRVCPSGIDIRQGATQQECIACARCVDACDSVMMTLGRDPGLIRYDELRHFGSQSNDQPTPAQKSTLNSTLISASRTPSARASLLGRPRILIYSVAWVTLFSVGLYQFIYRSTFHVRVVPLPTSTPWIDDGQSITNIFALKIGNQSRDVSSYEIELDDSMIKAGTLIQSTPSLKLLTPGDVKTLPVSITAPKGVKHGTRYQIKVRNPSTNDVLIVEKQWSAPSS